ncbi:MAG: type II toxin-antitoxin system RelE/ParE family toxin [Methanomicrobiales archaeon]|nr:type II toxin-antitoxin system RelE/ParE family toxin [Methanomicrobiales archaeon]
MEYRVLLTKSARRALLALPGEQGERIAGALRSLHQDPYSRVKRLKGSQLFSMRVGDYRILLTIRRDQLLVLVIRIGHRGNVYRGL